MTAFNRLAKIVSMTTVPLSKDFLNFLATLVLIESKPEKDISKLPVQQFSEHTMDYLRTIEVGTPDSLTVLKKLLIAHKEKPLSEKQTLLLRTNMKNLRNYFYPYFSANITDPSANKKTGHINLGMNKDQVNLLSACLRYMAGATSNTPGEAQKKINNYTLISSKFTHLLDPRLTALFDVTSHKAVSKEDAEAALALVLKTYKATNKSPSALMQLPEAKRKQFSEANRRLRDYFRLELKKFVRGHEFVSVKSIRVHQFDIGVQKLIDPSIDSLKVDEQGFLHAPDGTPVVAPKGGNLELKLGAIYRLNPNFAKSKDRNPNYLSVQSYRTDKDGKPIDGWSPFYKKTNLLDAVSSKQSKADEFEINITPTLAKLKKDLVSHDYNTRVLATMVYITLITASRVGSTKNKNKGISTLSIKNVLLKSDGIKLDYIGKSGMHQVTVINNDISDAHTIVQLKKNIIEFRKGRPFSKTDDTYLFTLQNGEIPVNSEINGYLKKVSGAPITMHKIRHAVGNKIFKEEEAKLKAPSDAKEAKAAFVDIMTQVGSKLGHQRTTKEGGTETVWKTASSSYVSPNLQKDFFTKHNINVPADVEKLISQNIAEDAPMATAVSKKSDAVNQAQKEEVEDKILARYADYKKKILAEFSSPNMKENRDSMLKALRQAMGLTRTNAQEHLTDPAKATQFLTSNPIKTFNAIVRQYS